MDLYKRIEERIEELGLSYAAASRRMPGKKPDAYFSNLLAQRSDPRTSTLIDIARALDTTPNELCGIGSPNELANTELDQRFVAAQAEALAEAAFQRAKERLMAKGLQPTIQDVMSWASLKNGELDTEDPIAQFLTIYEVPGQHNQLPNCVFIGDNSLAKKSLSVEGSDHLNRIMSDMSSDFLEKLVRDQLQINETDPQISAERICQTVEAESVDVDFLYHRLYLKRTLKDGRSVILNFSQLL